MLWDENDAISNLNVEIPTSAGWVLLEVQDINDSGQIVDDGLIEGVNQAFLLTPVAVPEPSLLLPLGIGL